MIPIYQPYLKGNVKKYVDDAMESTWISSRGKYLDLFAEGLSNLTNRRFVSLCSNGTTALDLAFKALGISMGDEVVTVAFTYVASTNAILIQGATPVFVDINASDWNMNTALIEKHISSKTKAILVANVYGYPVDFIKIQSIADKHGLYIIEDAAESLGAEYKGQMSGSFGDISTFSFFGNKTITTGEGGAILTDNPELFNKIEVLKNQGNSVSRRYYHDCLGYNCRMTNIQAAIGLSQLEILDEILEKKSKIARTYRDSLSNHMRFQNETLDAKTSNWIVSGLFSTDADCERVTQALGKRGVETRPLFYPIDDFNFYSKQNDLDITYDIYSRGICLPSFPGLELSELNFVIETINGCFKNE